MKTDGRIHLLLIDDHPVFRRGLAEMLNGQEGMEVIGEADTGHEGVRKAVDVITNGVDLDMFRPAADRDELLKVRRRLGIRPEDILLLSVGPVTPRKASDLIVEAWSRLAAVYPDLHLVLVGPRHDLAYPHFAAFHDHIHSRRVGRTDQG